MQKGISRYYGGGVVGRGEVKKGYTALIECQEY